jgi:hypothetical protein
MRAIRLLGLVSLLPLALGCAGASSESLELSDKIVDAAIQLAQSDRSEAEVSYTLNIDAPSLIAIVPASGVDRTQLPADATEAQVTALLDAVQVWNGRVMLAVVWASGNSSGPSLEGHLSVPRQYSVLKPGRGAITVRLVRDPSGTISVAGLR